MNWGRYLGALKWEFLQNLPLILGFVAAVRLRFTYWVAAFVVLGLGIGIGIIMMHYTEPFLHQEKYPQNWRGDLINFALFLLMAVPFLFYFSVQNRWINWKTDLAAGVVLGVLLTLGQSLGWQGKKSRLALHGIAMAVSFPLIMIGLRLAFLIPSWVGMLALGVLVTWLASALITWIDYRKMYIDQELMD